MYRPYFSLFYWILLLSLEIYIGNKYVEMRDLTKLSEAWLVIQSADINLIMGLNCNCKT